MKRSGLLLNTANTEEGKVSIFYWEQCTPNWSLGKNNDFVIFHSLIIKKPTKQTSLQWETRNLLEETQSFQGAERLMLPTYSHQAATSEGSFHKTQTKSEQKVNNIMVQQYCGPVVCMGFACDKLHGHQARTAGR